MDRTSKGGDITTSHVPHRGGRDAEPEPEREPERERTSRGPVVETPSPAVRDELAASLSTRSRLRAELSSPRAIRDAFVLHELLSPPMALRDARDRGPSPS